MTLKNVISRVLFVASVTFLASCSLEDDSVNFQFVNLQVVEAELPESFELYKTYQIRVTYLKPNNCTFFEGFDITKSDTAVRNVVVVGSELLDSSCAQVTDEVEEIFNFTCYYEETYTFRFWAGEDANGADVFLEYQVPVQPYPQTYGNN
jgi:hypothetical protein